jgi:hypothetical protein
MTAISAIRSAALPSLALTAMLVALTPNASRAENQDGAQLETISIEANDPVYRVERHSGVATANAKPRAETTGEDPLARHDVDLDFITNPTPDPVPSNPEIAD